MRRFSRQRCQVPCRGWPGWVDWNRDYELKQNVLTEHEGNLFQHEDNQALEQAAQRAGSLHP